MKNFLAPLMIIALAIAPRLCAQTIINLDFKQNPLFEVSTNNVNAALPGDGTTLTLGADLTVAGGSGTYTYEWTDSQGMTLGNEPSVTISDPGYYILTVSDQCDCSQEVRFNVEAAGIDATTIPGVSIVTNGSNVIIEGTESIQASLFSPAGVMTALHTPTAPTTTFSFSDVAPGVYLIQIVTVDNSIITQKIRLN